ncbi:MAG: fibronectin type III domain-containing protein, partial [Microbacteriaceae bacterium]
MSASAAYTNDVTTNASGCNARQDFSSNEFRSVVYAPAQGRWVALVWSFQESGYDVDDYCTLTATSTDAVTWTVGVPNDADFAYNVAYGNGVLMATGDDGAFSSSDGGSTWQRSTSPWAYQPFGNVAFGNNRFLIIDELNRVYLIATPKSPSMNCYSEDKAFCWSFHQNFFELENQKGPEGGYGALVYSAGRFVAYSNGHTYVTIDGSKWQKTSAAPAGFNGFTAFAGMATDGTYWIGAPGWTMNNIPTGKNAYGTGQFSRTTTSITVQFAGVSEGTRSVAFQYSTDGVNYCDFFPPVTLSANRASTTVTGTLRSTCDGTDLSQNSVYQVTVRATNGPEPLDTSTNSSSIDALTNPSTPTAIAKQNAAEVTLPRFSPKDLWFKYTVTCSADNDDALSGRVERNAGSSSSDPLTVSLDPLTKNRTYTCRTVAQLGGEGFASVSNPSNTFVPFDIPDVATQPVATPLDGGTTLRWVRPADNSSAITGYTVRYSTSNAMTNAVTVAVAPTNQVTVNGVASTGKAFEGFTNRTAYYFQVQATNTAGTSNWSPVATSTPRAPMKITVD